MPIVRTAVKSGTTSEIKEKIVMGIHSALVEGIGMPQDELFNLVQDYDPADFFYSRSFNGVARSDNVIVVEITMRRGRSDAMKTALYAAITRNLEQDAQVSPKDVLIFMHENDYSDWSVGNGKFAMKIVQQPGDDA
ncbi:tautomerase family protein [Primorskyibacter aestuariivivens]|uniref:tautomerase family protein n=1 Tax=Primorskyibacter aestuariivivens TaxID=1888912 RepID=UPI002300B082|nr:tautomerase family protein [Primorskyibacter aestuariivivens]MDA7429114.1 tautomerase family protein [Primorskyibacter aestuariivivens]